MAFAQKLWGADTIAFEDKFLSVDEVLSQSGLDFQVSMQPTYLANGIQIPKNNAIVREDTGTVLGIAGDRYELLNNKQAFSFFQPFVENRVAYIDNIGSFSNGLTFIQAKVVTDPVEITKGDVVESYITLLNSFNGKSSVVTSFTPRRLFCTNQMPMLKSSKHLKVKHTKNIHITLNMINQIMDTAKSEFLATTEQYKFLASKGIDKKQLREYIKVVLSKDVKDKSEEVEIRESRIERIETIFESGRGLDHNTRNYFGAFNAINEYINHEAGRSAENRLTSLWVGANAQLNQKALDVALQHASY